MRGFFASIPHAPLLAHLRRRIGGVAVLGLFGRIVAAGAVAPGIGLPIGTLVSQHLANAYLEPVDRLVVERLRPGAYVRYMDDMVLWGGDKGALVAAVREVGAALAAGGLTLRPPVIQRTRHRLGLLGWRLDDRGRMQLGRRGRRRYAAGLAALADDAADEADRQIRTAALTGWVAHGDDRRWRRALLARLGADGDC